MKNYYHISLFLLGLILDNNNNLRPFDNLPNEIHNNIVGRLPEDDLREMVEINHQLRGHAGFHLFQNGSTVVEGLSALRRLSQKLQRNPANIYRNSTTLVIANTNNVQGNEPGNYLREIMRRCLNLRAIEFVASNALYFSRHMRVQAGGRPRNHIARIIVRPPPRTTITSQTERSLMMICFDYRRTLEELDISHLVPRAIDNAPFDGNFPAMLQQFPNLRRLDLGFSVPLVMVHILLSCPNLQSLKIYICIRRGSRNVLVAIPPNDNEVNQRLQAQIIPLRILRIQSQIVTQEICQFIHQHLRLLDQLSIQGGVSLMRDFINSLDVLIGNNSNIAGLSLDNIPGDVFRVLERIHLCFPNLTHLTIHRCPIR